MKLELDKRIDSLSDIFNFSDVENAKEFVGQKGYFTNNIYFLKNIQSCKYGTLENIFSDSILYNTFCRKEDGAYYEFFIPESFLKQKEKKFKPYTLEEFIQNIGDVGACVRYKHKDSSEVFRSVITEIRETSGDVVLGSLTANLNGLFCQFEYFNGEAWVPFGVEE